MLLTRSLIWMIAGMTTVNAAAAPPPSSSPLTTQASSSQSINRSSSQISSGSASGSDKSSSSGPQPSEGSAPLDQKAPGGSGLLNQKAVLGANGPQEKNVQPNPSSGSVTTSLDRTSMPPFQASGTWTSVPCTAPTINDADAPGDQRWQAADASTAWKQILEAFSNPQLSNPPGDYPEDLPGFIWNAFHYRDAPDCGNIADPSCDVTEQCGDPSGAPPAIFLIMNSITYIHRIVDQQSKALQQGATTIQGQMKDMVDTFAPQPPKDISEEILKVILDSVTFGIGVGSAYFWNVAVNSLKFLMNNKEVRSALKDSFNAGIAYSFTANKDALKPDPSNPDDLALTLSDFLSEYFAQTQNYTAQWLLDTISLNYTEDATPLTNLIDGGNMLLADQQLTNNGDVGSWGDVVSSQATFLYGNLIPAAWQLSPKKYHPFVLRVDKNEVDCNEPLPKSDHLDGETKDLKVGDVMSDDTAKNNRWCDPQGNSWFLLTGHWSDDCATGGCVGGSDLAFQSMDGSDPDNLDGKKWGGITMKDMILSSYGGFQKNGNKNGYEMDTQSTDVVNDDLSVSEVDGPASGTILSGGKLTPGFFNFTICLDYHEAINTISRVWNHGDQSAPVCGTTPSNGGVESSLGPPGSFTPGWCGVHVTQYQKNEGDENLSGEYESTITITDAGGSKVGEANKEPNGEPVIVVDSSLPNRLLVDASGKVDSDPVQFWYADQYWDSNSQANKCKVGSYDSGHRDMDCGFNCGPPPSGQPPKSATANHPLPTAAKTAVPGPNSLVNTFTTASSSAPAPSGSSGPSPKPDYIQGWCGYHLTQYQKNEDEDTNPTANYEFEVTVFEASTDQNEHKPKVIGTLGKTQIANGASANVTGDMPNPLVVSVEKDAVDSSPVDFSYAGTSWTSKDKYSGGDRCATGSKDDGYQNGKREFDCGFSC